MAKAQRQVSAAIPRLAFAGDRFKAAGPEKQDFPAFLERANVKWKRESYWRARSRGLEAAS